MHHLASLVGDVRRNDDFARCINLNAHGFRTLVFVHDAALVCHRKLSYVFELIAEKLDAHRVLGCSRKDVDDAAAHSELPALGDHVNALVCVLDQLEAQLWQEILLANLEG